MPPSVERMKDEDVLKTARRMYLGGFFFLPWLWLVNYLYFRPILHRPSLDPLVKQYVYRSLIGSIVVAIPFLIWFIVFQTQRASWGVVGEKLSLTYPRGY